MPEHVPEGRPHRPRRPTLRADLSEALGCDSNDPAARHERAHTTARAVLAAGRSGTAEQASLVTLGDTVGLDELAQLWRHAEPGTLPATLWALYLLRAWCHRSGAEVARLYRAGRRHAEVADVIAGVPEAPDAGDMARLADTLLADVFSGDLGTSLERAAAFSRILAAGRSEQATAGGDASPGELGARALEVAAQLERAAAAWRAGSLH